MRRRDVRGDRHDLGVRASRRFRRHRARRLQTRLFLWFLGAIVFAVLSAIGTIGFMNGGDSPLGPARLASRTIAANLARRWDDPAACEAYLAGVRESVGLDLRLRRDTSELPIRVHRAGRRGEIVFEGNEIVIPVVRGGMLVGAVELVQPTAPRSLHWAVPLVAALFVLGLAARMVSRRIARPLESVAHAAERFGEGDLSTRIGLGDRPRRWVAEEVREVARAFDTMAERIEGVVREQRELLGAISHELRSPLGRARVALEIARDRSVEPLPAFDEIERQLSDVDAILGDLLAAARVGLSDLHAQPTPLVAWLKDRIAGETAPPAIELHGDASEVQVLLEPALMNRALNNVLANARAHGHPVDRPLEVHLERGPRVVRVIVRDHGPGFPPDVLERAFEPFVKGSVARTPGAGSGLGLALVRRIVEAHGGHAFARNVTAVEARAPGEASADRPSSPPPPSPSAAAPHVVGAEVGFELPCDSA